MKVCSCPTTTTAWSSACASSPRSSSTPPAAAANAVYLALQPRELAAKVALPIPEVVEILERLIAARLIVTSDDAGIAAPGLVIPEVGRLLEFIEFLELRERYGS